MKQIYRIVLVIGFAVAPLLSFAHSSALTALAAKDSLANVVNQVTPAVVKITVERKLPINPFHDSRKDRLERLHHKLVALGSGVIINAKQGYIVTNAHVVNYAKLIIVTLKDGRRYHAKLIGKSNGFDIAVIKIHAKQLKQIKIGDSDRLRVGDFVVAIGSPFGLTESVTSGVVSSINRTAPQIEGFQSFIQTDAPINPGNSGGALVNLQGQLIGINTAIISPTDTNNGIGFAIPSHMVDGIAKQLIKYGEIKRGMLGVIIQNLTPDLAGALGAGNIKGGALISQVIPHSPAARANLEVKDIIAKLNGKKVLSNAELRNNLGLLRPGTKITLTVLRQDRMLKIHATVGNPKKFLTPIIPYLSGMRLENYSELAPDSRYIKGILVTEANDNSDGALAGIIGGDIIIAANGTPVHSIKELAQIASHSQDRLLIKIVRDNKNLYLVINRS
ncbi:MAG: Do family serine endopeptidase [Gammaproteobacteria bacterium]|nr:Do family serine endopeptidase [Gammaproteobacteria bacterium]